MASDFNIFEWVRTVTASSASTKARACAFSMIQCADKNGITWVTREKLSALTGCKERATQAQLQELEELGLIERHGRVIRLVASDCQNLHPYVENVHPYVENVHEHAGQGVQISAPRVQELAENVQKTAPITTHISTHISTQEAAACVRAENPAEDGVDITDPIDESLSNHELPEVWIVDEAAKFEVELKPSQGAHILANALGAGLSIDETKAYVTNKLAELAGRPPRLIVKVLIEDPAKWRREQHARSTASPRLVRYTGALKEDPTLSLPNLTFAKDEADFLRQYDEWVDLCRTHGVPAIPRGVSKFDREELELIEAHTRRKRA